VGVRGDVKQQGTGEGQSFKITKKAFTASVFRHDEHRIFHSSREIGTITNRRIVAELF
jgi:hypothetical protein